MRRATTATMYREVGMTYGLETLETEMGALRWRSATRARAAADACGSMSRWVRAMKILLRLCLLAVIGLPVAALIAVWLCFQDAPLIARTPSITPADIERAKRIVEKHDPRKARPGTLRTIVASPQDLDLALNYAAGQFLNGSTRVVLQPGHALVDAARADELLLEWYRTSLRPLSAYALRQAVSAARQGSGLLSALGSPLDAIEQEYLARVVASHDGNEGIEAYVARRTPLWKNR